MTLDHKLYKAIEALREIRDKQGIVCSEFALCNHPSCRSSYTAWTIADKALADIEEINKYGCVIYKRVDDLGVHRFYKDSIENWLREGKGVAVYSKLKRTEIGTKGVTKKYCSFGTRSSTIPDCDIPPATMPRRYGRAGIHRVYYLIGYIPKADSKTAVTGN